MRTYSYWLEIIDSYDLKSYAIIKANLFDNIRLIMDNEDIPEGEQLMEVQNIMAAYHIYTNRSAE